MQDITGAYETTVNITAKEYGNRVEEAEVQHQLEENELEALQTQFKHYKKKRCQEIAGLVCENQKLSSEIESYKNIQSEINAYRIQMQQTAVKIQELTEAQMALEETARSHLDKYQESETNWRHSQMENYLLKEELDLLRKNQDEGRNGEKIEQLEELAKKLNEVSFHMLIKCRNASRFTESWEK